MTTTNKNELCFLKLYQRFIKDNQTGKRLQPNGKRISAGTIANYAATLKLVKDFSEKKGFYLRLKPIRKLNSRDLATEKNYWRKFYKQFSGYLYEDCRCFDNYVGQCFKNIKVFFNYLNKELTILTGDFHKTFYIRKEDIQIHPLLPEELNHLIYNEKLKASLTPRLLQTKDFFVFGCTVALRVSDLLSLKKSNIRIINEQYYLSVRSEKTHTDTLIKLPPHAIAIVLKYGKLKGRLLPKFNKVNLNLYIKQLLEQAGFTHVVQKRRERRGKVFFTGKNHGSALQTRFCDIACTHTMRRTAITTMLCLGMNEQIVRRISGHSAHGKEFYRYVLWAQAYQDSETETMFNKLKEKGLNVV